MTQHWLPTPDPTESSLGLTEMLFSRGERGSHRLTPQEDLELILSLTAAGGTHHRPLAAWAAGTPSPCACRPGYMTHGGILTLSLHPIQDRPQQPQHPSAHHPPPTGSQGEPVALLGGGISGGCPPLPPTGSTSPSEWLGLQTPTCTPCPRGEGLPHVQLGEASAQLEQ